MKTRRFRILDIDGISRVEISKTQKEVFLWMDDYIENMESEWFDGSDDTFAILYKDGAMDFVDEDYDGHKIRRNNIASMVYNNAEDSIVYGGFSVNEYGVVTPSETMNLHSHAVQ